MRAAYQGKAKAEILAAWAAGHRCVLLQLPTGGGKTYMASMIIAEEAGYCIFAAHLDSLVGDTADRLREQGIPCGIVAPWAPFEPQYRIQVASLGTLHSRRLELPAELIILDECHRAKAKTVLAWLALYPKARLLGLTATPQRGDKQPLGDVFSHMVVGPSVKELIAIGALCQYTLLCTGGAQANRRGDGVAELEMGAGQWTRALYFAQDKAAGAEVATRLRKAWFNVEEIYGETTRKEREKIRARLRSRETDVIVGVGVFIEGFDEPQVDAVALDASFGPIGRFLQAVGRGMRVAEGKRGLTIYDLRGAVWRHGLPDGDLKWSLTGEACTRTEPGMRLLCCNHCAAVFRAASICPRCGRPVTPSREKPKPKTKAEKLQEYNSIPFATRRANFLATLVRVGLSRRMPKGLAEQWALNKVRSWEKGQHGYTENGH